MFYRVKGEELRFNGRGGKEGQFGSRKGIEGVIWSARGVLPLAAALLLAGSVGAQSPEKASDQKPSNVADQVKPSTPPLAAPKKTPAKETTPAKAVDKAVDKNAPAEKEPPVGGPPSLAVEVVKTPGLQVAGDPGVGAKLGILVDTRTGQALWDKNAHLRRPIASLTKVMTALLVLESGKLDETVTASKTANETMYSSIYLALGEKLTLRDVLWGIMLRSGNDACVAAAEHIDGSVEKFVERMNRRAKELGLENTQFQNPHGLHEEGHYSTAADMAEITLQAMKYPIFNEMVATKKHTIDRSIRKINAVFFNKSRILNRWDLADGVKTGYTRQAGFCFIGSATQDGWRLLSVVLKSPDTFEDTQKLLEFGFRNYDSLKVAEGVEQLATRQIDGARKAAYEIGPPSDIYAVVPKGGSVTLQTEFEDDLHAPISRGERVGKAEWFLEPAAGIKTVSVTEGPVMVASAPLMTLEPVEITPLAAAVQSSWKPLLALFLVIGALKYGTSAKNHRQRRSRVKKRSGRVGRRR